MGAVTIDISALIFILTIVVSLVATLWGYMFLEIRKLSQKKVSKDFCASHSESRVDTIYQKFNTVDKQFAHFDEKFEDSKTRNTIDHDKLEKQLNVIHSTIADIHECVIKLAAKSSC
jgi:hypothetical protein